MSSLAKYLEEATTKADYDNYIADQDAEIQKSLHNKEKLEAAVPASTDADLLKRLK